MARSRPCDLRAICAAGWPALIRDLRVVDRRGAPLQTSAAGPIGWALAPHDSQVTIDYAVDYTTLAENHWPAPRETAYSDGAMLYTLGRPLFVGSETSDTIHVRFEVPAGTHVAAPWLPEGAPFDALADNGVIIAHEALPRVVAGKFVLDMALFGRWQQRRDVVAHILGAHVTTFTRLLGFTEPGRYLATFLDDSEFAGESFPDSYALSANPDSDATQWGRIIGHEMFHYWNGSRLRGADYVSSQWFQEGMTEYYAILSMARNNLISSDAALARLSQHLRAHREFGKSLTASGERKDRGFYGTATLVALLLDITIRDRSQGRHSLDDVMRTLWRNFGATRKPYTQADVVAVMSTSANEDLTAFFRSYVEGDKPLPVAAALALAGLRLTRDDQNRETIADDAGASPERRAVWRSILNGRP